MTDNKRHKPEFEVAPIEESEREYTGFIPSPSVTVRAEKGPETVRSENHYYEKKDWKMGLITLYHCRQCEADRNDVDSIMEHILLHYPADKQEEVLAELLALTDKE